MYDATYRTIVYWVPPSPLGLVGKRWAIEHHCNLCRQPVSTEDLLSHTQDHARGGIVTNRPANGGVC